MRRNSGIIGPQTLSSVDSADGSFESFDVYNARLSGDWPREVEASIVPRETTVYRGNDYHYVDWELSNLPDGHTRHWRVVNTTNFNTYESATSADTFYEVTGVTYPEAQSLTLIGADLGDYDSGYFGYSTQYLDTANTADTTFQIELYSKDLNDNETIHAITPIITIPPTILTEPSVVDLNEGSSVTITYTIEGLSGTISNYLEIAYDTKGGRLELNYDSNNISYQYVGRGTYNSGTKTLTVNVTFSWTKDYDDYTPVDESAATVRLHYRPTSNNSFWRSGTSILNKPRPINLVKKTTAPTFYSPTGTLYEGTQYTYGFQFSESPAGNFTYFISFSSTSDWTDGSTSGNLSKSGNNAFVNKTWSEPNATFNDTFIIEIYNYLDKKIAESPTLTMNNTTPSVTSYSLEKLGEGNIPNFEVDESGSNVTYRLYYYGSLFSGKTITYELQAFTSGPAAGTNPISTADFVSGSFTGNTTVQSDTQGYFDFQLVADEELEGVEFFQALLKYNGSTMIGGEATPILVNDTSRPPPPPNDFDIETAGALNNISANNVSSHPKLWDRDEEWAYAVYAGQTTYAGAAVIKFYMINKDFDSNDIYTFYYDLSTGVLYNPNTQTDWDCNNRRCLSFNRTGTHYVWMDEQQDWPVIYQAATAWTIDQYSDQPTDDYNNSRYSHFRGQINRDHNGNYIYPNYTHVAFSDDDSKIIISGSYNGNIYYWVIGSDNGYNPATYNFSNTQNDYPNADAFKNFSSNVYSTNYETTVWGRFEFNRDGTEVTLYDTDSYYAGPGNGDGGPFLEKYILTTPFDMSTKAIQPAARLNIWPGQDWNRYSSNPGFWFVNQFFYDRVSEDRLYVIGSPSSSYYYMWDYEISTILRLEDRAGFNINTAELVDAANSTFSYSSAYSSWPGASHYTDDDLLFYNGSSNEWQSLEFTPNYSNPSRNYEININGEMNGPGAILSWASRGPAYSWGGGQIGYWQDGYNDNLLFTQGFNYQTYGSIQWIDWTQIDWTDKNPATDIHYHYNEDGTGKLIISWRNGNYEHVFRGYDISSDALQNVDNWQITNNTYTWEFGRSTGVYRNKAFGRFEFNKDGTEVTVLSLSNRQVLETYDLSSDPFNISLIQQSGTNAPIRSKNFSTDIGPWNIVDFVFQRTAPKTHLYIMTDENNSIRRYTYEMDAEYINNVGNTWGSGAETLDPYIVDYTGSVVDITFIDSDDAANFKTFMDDFLAISGAYSMYVHAQGTSYRFIISDGSGRSASVDGSTVTIDFNNGVSGVTLSDDTYGLNTIRFRLDVEVVTGDTSTNTASIGMAAGNATAIAAAFSNSGLGFSDFYGYGAIGYLFIDNTTALAAEVVAVNNTLGFAWDTNLSADPGFSNPTEIIYFSVDKEITGTGSATVVEAAALTKIVVTNYFTDGSNYFDMQFDDADTKSKALEIFRGWGQNYTNWNPTQWMVTSSSEAFWEPRFGNGSSIQDYNSTSFGVTNPNVFNTGPNNFGQPSRWRIFISPNLQSVPADPWGSAGNAFDPNNMAIADYQAPNFYMAYASNDSYALFEKPSKYMTAMVVGDGINRYSHSSVENMAFNNGIGSYGGLTWNASASYIGGGAAQFEITEMKYDPTALSFPVGVEYQHEINGSYHGFVLTDATIRQDVIDVLNESAGTSDYYYISAYDTSYNEGRLMEFRVGSNGAFGVGSGGAIEVNINRLNYGWDPYAPNSFGNGELFKP